MTAMVSAAGSTVGSVRRWVTELQDAHRRSWWRRLARWLDGPDDAAGPQTDWAGSRGTARRVRGAARNHPQVLDALLALLLAAVATPWLFHHVHGGAAVWLLQAGLVIPLVWRRRWPVGVFVVLSAVAFVQWLISDPLPADLALLIALATVACHRSRRTALAAAVVLEVGVIMAATRWSLAGSWIRSMVFLSGMVGAALLLGANMRSRRANMAALVERAERLEYERDQQARLTAVAERTRIAREMHDVLAHSLAVMISLADGAAAKITNEPQRAATAIAHVADLGRQSLRDTRNLLGVLRPDESPDSIAPQPDISQLGSLLSGVRATGLKATLTTSGEPFDVPPSAGLSVYRIVQEALTNSLKHAPGVNTVQIHLCYFAPDLRIEVTDDGRLPWPQEREPPKAVHSRSHGLDGMRERASLHNGTFAAGPANNGGWRVQAILPVGPGGPP
jgi:signal transduction histidine kinase